MKVLAGGRSLLLGFEANKGEATEFALLGVLELQVCDHAPRAEGGLQLFLRYLKIILNYYVDAFN